MEISVVGCPPSTAPVVSIAHWGARCRIALCVAAWLCGLGTIYAQAPGNVDTTFNSGTSGVNSYISSVALQSDGKIVIGGSFTNISGVARKSVARLNADGSVDTDFNPGTGANNYVGPVVVQSDGKVLVGGFFTVFNGVTRFSIARLNADGSLDTTFNPNPGANSFVDSVAVQTDGKIVIAGSFTSVNGAGRNRVARLNADGSVDTTFNPGTGANNHIKSVALQSDGKVVIGGDFTSFNSVGRNYVARLNADGSLDTDFSPDANNAVNSVALQSGGKVLLGGEFTIVNGVTRNYSARLDTDGGLDNTFNPGADGPVSSMAIQSDGKVVFKGVFTSVNGVGRKDVARLNADGSLDTAFDPGTGANDSVLSVALQGDGKVLVGGNFTSVNGAGRNRVARLNADGSVDAAFNPGTGANNAVNSVALQGDGKVLIGGSFTYVNDLGRNRVARLNANGSVDTAFNPGTGANDSVLSVALQSDGKIVIAGSFTSVNGAGRNRVARLNADGSLDTAFNPGIGANNAVSSVVVQTDGKIVIGGSFTSVNGVGRESIARLNANGSVDTTFNPIDVTDDTVLSVALQSDGKVLIGGSFTYVNGAGRNRVARLNADGSLDTAFDPGTGADGSVTSVVVQTDGKVLVGGAFTRFNGAGRNRVARLNADGSVDTAFNSGTGANNAVNSVALQGDGKVLVGGAFTRVNGVGRNDVARLNADGSLDTAFNPGIGANNAVSSVVVQTDGKIVIGGSFTSVNGSPSAYVARLFGDVASPAAPSVTTGAADTLQSASAVVRASINPQGAATSVVFQYGLTISYGSTTNSQSIGSGTAAVAVSATLTGLTPGTLYHYRAVAVNSVGTANGADATLTTLSVSQDWRQQYFSTTGNTGTAADGADPDGDGISNLLERALGLNPMVAGVTGLPTTIRDASTGRLTLTASKGAYASDLTFSAEASSDLVSWTTSGVTVLTNTSTTFQARDDGPADTRRFVRLRVSAP